MKTLAVTERPNPYSDDLDLLPLSRLMDLINTEDQLSAIAVRRVLPQLEKIAAEMIRRFQQGGRILYLGAGTSARLAVMDAAECPPTFGISPERIQTSIAGGPEAVFRAQEGGEDGAEAGRRDVQAFAPGKLDCVIGLAASGKTPYVVEGLCQARESGAYTALLSNSDQALECADEVVRCITGPEVLTGSTRMKAGTAEKMMLHTLSTTVMVKSGRTFGNRMCYISGSNKKLSERAMRTVMDVCDLEQERAESLLKESEGNLAVALLMGLGGMSRGEAEERLRAANGSIRNALQKDAEKNEA